MFVLNADLQREKNRFVMKYRWQSKCRRIMMIRGQIIAVEDVGEVGEEAALWLIDRAA